jgi:LuxR family maltose regulon positive regulatory protein
VARERNDLDEAARLLDEAGARSRSNRRHVLLWEVHAERALLCLAQGQVEQGLRTLRDARGEGHPPPPAGVAARLRAAGALLLLASVDPDGAEHALRSPDAEHDVTRSVRVLIDIERHDVPSARKRLDEWEACESLRAEIDRALLTAIVEDLDGDRRLARVAIADAVSLAEVDGHVRAFADVGAHAHRLVRRLHRSAPTAFLRRLVEAPRASRAGVVDVSPDLHEQLSDRELAVLRHLPSDLSNNQVAEQLFISVNTLKTHLGHIYQKLGVRSRREAIDRADQLHLL